MVERRRDQFQRLFHLLCNTPSKYIPEEKLKSIAAQDGIGERGGIIVDCCCSVLISS